MRPWRICSTLGLGLLALLTGNGCSFGAGQPTRYYVLTPMPRPSANAAAMRLHDVAIGVGPVQLPQYTNRPQMVTGNTNNELAPAPYEEWAEPLRDNFTRVLAENLSVLLATDRVAVFPWKGPMPIAYQVIVEVMHFLGETGGETSLVALWSIVGSHGREVLVSQRSSFREPAGQQGYEGLAAAMSRTVAALSRDIAAAIMTLAAPQAAQ
jgi:uncharacterized lipoprotein YmbA